jgi:hypothetical protein
MRIRNLHIGSGRRKLELSIVCCLEAKKIGEKKRERTRSSLLDSLSEQHHKYFMFYACFVDFDGRLLHLLIPLILAIDSIFHILS